MTGGLFRFANKANAYAVDGGVMYSMRRGLGFNSCEPVSERDGLKYVVNVSKISGSFTWTAGQILTSDSFNPNDLGLQFNNNIVNQYGVLNYRKFKPFWKVNNLYTYLGVAEKSLFRPTRYSESELNGGANTTFRQAVSHHGF